MERRVFIVSLCHIPYLARQKDCPVRWNLFTTSSIALLSVRMDLLLYERQYTFSRFGWGVSVHVSWYLRSFFSFLSIFRCFENGLDLVDKAEYQEQN